MGLVSRVEFFDVGMDTLEDGLSVFKLFDGAVGKSMVGDVLQESKLEGAHIR